MELQNSNSHCKVLNASECAKFTLLTSDHLNLRNDAR